MWHSIRGNATYEDSTRIFSMAECSRFTCDNCMNIKMEIELLQYYVHIEFVVRLRADGEVKQKEPDSLK
ncbi:hypothetical protein T265_15888, partial [Opisthorchis viverrini]